MARNARGPTFSTAWGPSGPNQNGGCAPVGGSPFWAPPDGAPEMPDFEPPPPPPSAYTTDSLNRYTVTPFDVRGYDANGNLKQIITTAGVRDFTYDCENRLVRHTDSATNGVATYAYDPAGRATGLQIRNPYKGPDGWSKEAPDQTVSFDAVYARSYSFTVIPL